MPTLELANTNPKTQAHYQELKPAGFLEDYDLYPWFQYPYRNDIQQHFMRREHAQQ